MTTQTSVRRSLTVPGRPEQAAAARQFAARALGQRHPYAETAILLVSEFVTNSLRHSASAHDGGTITITVITSPGDLVRVEVTDDGAATLPMVHSTCSDDEDGRGMELVSALASAWSCRRDGSRTITWFELMPGSQQADRRMPCGSTGPALPRRVPATLSVVSTRRPQPSPGRTVLRRVLDGLRKL